jgi:molecular chaperone HtpG
MRSFGNGRLSQLGASADTAGQVTAFLDRCAEILADNQMPFFPAYTDHGISHISSVLEAGERLIPDSVWEADILKPDDAAVLAAASYLHDLGLHVREHGFLELVAKNSRFTPVTWFDQAQTGRSADRPWFSLWEEFRREARSFSQSQLDRLLGPDHGDPPQIMLGDFPTNPAEWTLNDRLLIGEFLRRHHARLAHEIAINGFPGINSSEFPLLQDSIPRLAQPIGVVARSHGEDLRTMTDYLDSRVQGDLRPDGVAQLYLMGVLRIADYFQLDSTRATPLLQHLRERQSPVSVEEWKKHQAVAVISWDHKDPEAISIQASDSHNLRTHLQLAELLKNLQRELDHTSAVLAESLGSTKLSPLQLSLRRVRTNLDDPDLHARLPFVPQPSFLRSAEDLFRLMAKDLYGNEPSVAGRELLQNAVDAVRERRRWEEVNDRGLDPDSFHRQPADIVVEIREIDDKIGLLRVADRGIGMTPATVRASFLTAGATFSPAKDESEIRVDWMKVGRFGIGVFAAFLLGSQIRVTTRHLEESRGITFTARLDDELVQLDWDDKALLGTEIVVPYEVEELPYGGYGADDRTSARNTDLLMAIAGFFELSDPGVEFLLARRDGKIERLRRNSMIPPSSGRLPDGWRKVPTDSFDAVLWSIPKGPLGFIASDHWHGFGTNLAHNGFLITKPSSRGDEKPYKWSDSDTRDLIRTPSVAIFDTKEKLKIALNRYELASQTLPFEEELLEAIGEDIVAHALACGQAPHPLAQAWGLNPVVSRTGWIPFLPQLVEEYVTGDLCVLLVGDPSESKLARRFLSGRISRAGWRDIPYRAAVSPHEAYLDELDLEWLDIDDSIFRGHAEKEIRYSIDRGSERLFRFPLAGVLVPFGESPITLFGDENDKAAVEANEMLTNIANELATDEAPDFFALVTLRPHERDDEEEMWLPAEPMAFAWDEMVGGMIARSKKGRIAQREEISGRERAVGVLANKWDRLARAGEEARKKEAARLHAMAYRRLGWR